jgi:hypothetical protein
VSFSRSVRISLTLSCDHVILRQAYCEGSAALLVFMDLAAAVLVATAVDSTIQQHELLERSSYCTSLQHFCISIICDTALVRSVGQLSTAGRQTVQYKDFCSAMQQIHTLYSIASCSFALPQKWRACMARLACCFSYSVSHYILAAAAITCKVECSCRCVYHELLRERLQALLLCCEKPRSTPAVQPQLQYFYVLIDHH